MLTYNPENERIKHLYFAYLKEAKRYSESTVDEVASALARFEADTRYRDFRSFRAEQAVAFKRRLADRDSQSTGDKLSAATLNAILGNLKKFFRWLAGQPGYRSSLTASDAEYFNLSGKESRVATARRERPFPTVEQIRHVIDRMPAGTDIERRNRALVAFTLLTGARDSAIVSFKLKHVDLKADRVYQDAREVRTKFSKTFHTDFFPVGGGAREIVAEWVTHLRDERLWGEDDSVFPATAVGVGEDQQFGAVGLKREHWTGASPMRAIFRAAFKAAGLPYFNPHSFRKTLVRLGQTTCQTPEHFKAWSQNLGHESVMTTFRNYGTVDSRRQGEIMKSFDKQTPAVEAEVDKIAEAVARKLLVASQSGQWEAKTRHREE